MKELFLPFDFNDLSVKSSVLQQILKVEFFVFLPSIDTLMSNLTVFFYEFFSIFVHLIHDLSELLSSEENLLRFL